MRKLFNIRQELHNRRGQTMVEALLPLVIIFALVFISVMIFSVYASALRGQNAMTRTAAYVSATGTWTAQQQLMCMQALPGYDPDLLASQQERVGCQVFEEDENGSWIPIAPMCGPAESEVQDCLTDPDRVDDRSFVSYEGRMRIQISYEERIGHLCLFGVCAGGEDYTIERSVLFFSQTRRES